MGKKDVVTSKKDAGRKKRLRAHTPKNISGVSVTVASRHEAVQVPPVSPIDQIDIATHHDRAEQLRALLDEWAADESGEQEATWEELKSGIDSERERLGMRRLFDG